MGDQWYIHTWESHGSKSHPTQSTLDSAEDACAGQAVINALFRNMNKTKHIPPENIHLTKPTQSTPPTHTPPPPSHWNRLWLYLSYNVTSELLIKKKKSNCMIFLSHCCESTLGLKISTHIILHFPHGRIHLDLCLHCFPFLFCTGRVTFLLSTSIHLLLFSSQLELVQIV